MLDQVGVGEVYQSVAVVVYAVANFRSAGMNGRVVIVAIIASACARTVTIVICVTPGAGSAEALKGSAATAAGQTRVVGKISTLAT